MKAILLAIVLCATVARADSPAPWSAVHGRQLAPAALPGNMGSAAFPLATGGGSGTNATGSATGYFDTLSLTNSLDEVPYEDLHWTFGGFHASTNAPHSSVTITNLSCNAEGLRFKWTQDLSAWGLAREDADAVACLFVMDEDGRWIGGKFEWISSSRDTRQFKNIRDGYNGWSLRDIPNPTEVAFVIFRKDGKKRSNIIAATWDR